ncbi:hypothetical protein [Methyloversatilis sp.]|uniref:hypothetical protein n=1 Tax=Methyloversatilis sp. TaxID=2569862 RepID=UPI0035B151AC
MRKIAHYWYSDGNEIAVFVEKRNIFVVDPKTGYDPMCVDTGTRDPYPYNGTPHANDDYFTLGLYYGYEMKDTGWDGDC